VIADVEHHVTPRGNGRQIIPASDAEPMAYIGLQRRAASMYGLGVLGYCRRVRCDVK